MVIITTIFSCNDSVNNYYSKDNCPWKFAGVRGLGKDKHPQKDPQNSISLLSYSEISSIDIPRKLAIKDKKLEELDSCGCCGCLRVSFLNTRKKHPQNMNLMEGGELF